MDTNGSNSNTHENQHSEISNDASNDSSTEQVVFVNHAEVAWHERRRQWVGDQSQKPKRVPKEPIMSYVRPVAARLAAARPATHRRPSTFITPPSFDDALSHIQRASQFILGAADEEQQSIYYWNEIAFTCVGILHGTDDAGPSTAGPSTVSATTSPVPSATSPVPAATSPVLAPTSPLQQSTFPSPSPAPQPPQQSTFPSPSPVPVSKTFKRYKHTYARFKNKK